MRKIFYILIIFFIIWTGFLLFKFINFNFEKSDSDPVGTQNLAFLQNQNNLLLFYNKNLINNPPATWQEFLDNQYSVALGTADNIEYSSEILVLLMIQQGVEWPDFNNNLGKRALQFYTQFADSSKKVYTWDKTRKNNFQEFNSGNINIIFALVEDKLKLEEVNYGIVQMPRIAISQMPVNLPELSDAEKAILDDLIESVASRGENLEDAIYKAEKLIQGL